MTMGRTALPWWVAPGAGALIGAVVIAVAAQGSLAGARVGLPVGPRLTSAAARARPAPSTTVLAGGSVIVAPVHPVVTQSVATGTESGSPSTPDPSTASGPSAGGRSAASSVATPPAAGVAPSSAGPTVGPSSSGVAPVAPTATTRPSAATTTTRPPATTTTTTTDPSDDGSETGDR